MFYNEDYCEVRGCLVRKYNRHNDAIRAVAEQIHEMAVEENEVIDDDWNDNRYRSATLHEAKLLLEEKGEGPAPTKKKQFVVVLR